MSSPELLADTPPSDTAPKSTMSRANRLAARNVLIYDAQKPKILLGGLCLVQELTNANIYAMLDIFVIPPASSHETDNCFTLRSYNGTSILRDNASFKEGIYYLEAAGPVHLSDEQPLVRALSQNTGGTRVKAFTEAIRLRDNHCIISGRAVKYRKGVPSYTGFQAAHVFPLGYESIWRDQNCGRWITEIPTKGGSINSVQNGLLLSNEIHHMFDTYALSIDPDNGYKVVCFDYGGEDYADKTISTAFLDDPLRPPDQLLRWHFRQAVLVNMKGTGEPVFEHDFPPGSDIMEDIREGPKAAERMEYEIFGRLALHMEIC